MAGLTEIIVVENIIYKLLSKYGKKINRLYGYMDNLRHLASRR